MNEAQRHAYRILTEAARDLFFSDFSRQQCYAFLMLMNATDHILNEPVDDPGKWSDALWRLL